MGGDAGVGLDGVDQGEFLGGIRRRIWGGGFWGRR